MTGRSGAISALGLFMALFITRLRLEVLSVEVNSRSSLYEQHLVSGFGSVRVAGHLASQSGP